MHGRSGAWIRVPKLENSVGGSASISCARKRGAKTVRRANDMVERAVVEEEQRQLRASQGRSRIDSLGGAGAVI